MRYRKQQDGDVIFVPNYQGWRVACCDCHLVHDFFFTKTSTGVQILVHRNNRATAAKRRRKRRASPHLSTM